MEEEKKMMKKKEATGVCSSLVLPPGIEAEILSRLPVKSLLRFKCVDKSWQNRIQSPAFIAMHLNRFGKNNDGFLLYIHDPPNEYFLQYHHPIQSNEIPSTKWLLGDSSRYIIGSSNGLVCLTNILSTLNPSIFSFTMHIWNPSTRTILELPNCDFGATFFPSILLGFGFCPKLNDYKVVMITGSTPLSDSPPIVLQVYSLSTNAWKKITIGNPGWDYLQPQIALKGFIINGVSYWLARQRKSPRRILIMAFKFDEEVFEEINLPNHHTFRNLNFGHLFITGYRNLLSLVAKPGDANVSEIWVMKEYGVADSWVKQFTIAVPIPRPEETLEVTIMIFEKKGELLLLVLHEKERRLVCFNTMTNQIEEQQLSYPALQTISCKESLVSLPGGVSAEFLEEYKFARVYI